ncbi:hypothetical protein ACIRD2_18125 [Streptomyces sp. NPDC093595]|uniref:hypothetical protein n=1 Tax=Streptomyces sp. NPDC093595 TaxID=3366045 RepID=UPI0037F5E6A5
MTLHQHPSGMALFRDWLGVLVERLDPRGGWYGVFCRRDPAGMRACLDGVEIPPWDVVEALLQDLATAYGDRVARAEAARARDLYAAAIAAHDGRPGARAALHARLERMRREQAYAAARGEELAGLLSAAAEGSDEADRLARDLAWLHDDHARASARIDELRARLAALPPVPAPTPPPAPSPGPPPVPAPASVPAPPSAPVPAPAPEAPRGDGDPRGEGATGGGRWPWSRRGGAGGVPRKRPRGARYAWIEEPEPDGDEPGPAAGAADAGHEALTVPELPVAGAVPRGARFGGAPAAEEAPPPPAGPTEEDRHAAREAVAALVALRARGRGGEAHALLCEAAAGPAARLPLLAAGLRDAGLAPDWATLLWEAASLPPEHLAAVAGELGAAGLDQDARHLLRQGVARPLGETATAVLALDEAGREGHVRALLDAFVRSRTAEDAARLAAYAPHVLVPRLLAAHRAVPARERAEHGRGDLVHALRVAGLA